MFGQHVDGHCLRATVAARGRGVPGNGVSWRRAVPVRGDGYMSCMKCDDSRTSRSSR